MHLMWNWMQGSFFGIEVSGLTSISSAPLLKEIDKGPTWLTGSAYGIEGGIVCTVAIAVSTAVIYLLPVIKPDPELLAMTSETPISRPGTMPARYIAAIEVEISPPHTIIRIDGGMMTASTAETAVIAMEKERS